MDYLSIIDQYYPSENELRRILLTHSRQVADRCLLIARKHPELKLDTEFLEEAAMLHDIGIYACDAPSIQCFGTEPYICHVVNCCARKASCAMPRCVNAIRVQASPVSRSLPRTCHFRSTAVMSPIRSRNR